ncbi:MAG: ribonuclease HI [Congregibacter sp.]
MYTDGACRGNPGPGGWGALLLYGEHRRELFGGEAETTNNRMELLAAIEGLRGLSEPCEVTLFTDSTYVMKGITEWIDNWKRRDWKTASKKPVANADLWRQLDEQNQRHTVSWQWVKGHSGNPGNECADQLANRGIDEL